LFGATLLILILALLVVSFVQGNRRTVSDSPMQRLISAPTADLFYVYETARVEDGVMYVTGQFVGVPNVTPETAEEWQQHTKKVAEVIVKELKGLPTVSALSLKQYHRGELVGEITLPVK
jgi:hypothetical protein